MHKIYKINNNNELILKPYLSLTGKTVGWINLSKYKIDVRGWTKVTLLTLGTKKACFSHRSSDICFL